MAVISIDVVLAAVLSPKLALCMRANSFYPVVGVHGGYSLWCRCVRACQSCRGIQQQRRHGSKGRYTVGLLCGNTTWHDKLQCRITHPDREVMPRFLDGW